MSDPEPQPDRLAAEEATDRILSDLDHLAQLMMTGYGASPER